jgi:hypothetical protein
MGGNTLGLKCPDFRFSETGSATLTTQSSDSFSKSTRTLLFNNKGLVRGSG